jgi:Family of unknown function (DUF6999)
LVVRPLARLSIVLVQLVRIVVPNRLTSSRPLHALIVWGMKNFVQSDANYLILRHLMSAARSCVFSPTTFPDIAIRSPAASQHDRGPARQCVHPRRAEQSHSTR